MEINPHAQSVLKAALFLYHKMLGGLVLIIFIFIDGVYYMLAAPDEIPRHITRQFHTPHNTNGYPLLHFTHRQINL